LKVELEPILEKILKNKDDDTFPYMEDYIKSFKFNTIFCKNPSFSLKKKNYFKEGVKLPFGTSNDEKEYFFFQYTIFSQFPKPIFEPDLFKKNKKKKI
jgi:hypothetical protein